MKHKQRMMCRAASCLAHTLMIVLFMAAADLWLHANYRCVYAWVPLAVSLAGALVYFLLARFVRWLRRS